MEHSYHANIKTWILEGGVMFTLSHLIELKSSKMVIQVSLSCFYNFYLWGSLSLSPSSNSYLSTSTSFKTLATRIPFKLHSKIKFNKQERWAALDIFKLIDYYYSVMINVKCTENNLDNYLRTWPQKDNFTNK